MYSNSKPLFNFIRWAFYYHNRLGWVRLFDRGIKWKDTSIHGLIFSERSGYAKGVQIGKWRISYLPPCRALSLEGSLVDLHELERRLDESLAKETKETLTEWLRQQSEIDQTK